VVQATGQDTVPATMAKVTRVLMDSHRIDDPTQKDFEVRSNLDLLEQYGEVTAVFTLFLASIAAIALLVGGIGVMNIMLVTVTERTREIGIRKAVGAQRGDIVGQFLLEATMLSAAGGLLGIAIGVSVGSLSIGGFQLVVAPFSVVLAFAVSVAIGLFFGFYPAHKAAAMSPITALRYE
jgi:putative ABC transport system permease protein